MRIRNARMRDAEVIVGLIPAQMNMDVNAVSDRIAEDTAHIFVATDFSANILGCALAVDQIYISEHCSDASLADELRKKYTAGGIV